MGHAMTAAGDELLTGGEALVRALCGHAVTRVFGIPGTHNLEIYRHLAAYGIRHVTPRHEQGAGYAADGYARVTGRPGVVLTTTGPALLNAAAAVGQAYSDSVPLLVVSPGMPLRHPRLSTGLLHETRSQTEALRGVAAFSHRVSSVGEIDAAVARAFTLFRTGRPRPVHIEIPLDLLEAAERVGPARISPPLPRVTADPFAVREAARALAAAERPALVLGGGARDARQPCLALAERLGAPVVTTANGKGCVPETHPLSLGVSLHSAAVQKWLVSRDVVVAVGTELAESDFWAPPPPLDGTLVRIDIDPDQMYAGAPADVPLVGHARAVLEALLPELPTHTRVPGSHDHPQPPVDAAQPRLDPARPALSASQPSLDPARSPLDRARSPLDPGHSPLAPAQLPPHHARVPEDVRALRAARDAETATRDARWIPYLEAIRSVLAEDAVVTSDSAQCCYYGALPHLPIGTTGRYLHPTGFGTLGYALPAAIGAKVARPDRQVVALSGDGGLQFTVQELATAVQLRLPLPIVVFDNGGYGEIRDEMRARGDAPTAVDLPPVDLPALARAYGGHGTHACNADELVQSLTEALDRPAPTLITVSEETA
ncbi:thiamine pyrophosphate-dependent enzyme [Streptomyces sp. S.PB5]|uniref:thiamine pyrophosphate-dependent enzyme n=1 Tax=Streptomyces sp. S.PB5 TaxID=3020844 RepID=UPI0025B034AB|nr:thiamine pyrophosphate-dependent enzyme [Streptomyces sp. S.PB5]MDN3025475.1 thiamine pyrophosphate-binding protein [Streptomyces sp. S.PB5]